jgi:hypothetical protein
MLSPGCQAKKKHFRRRVQNAAESSRFHQKTAQKEIKNYFPYFSC